jgi:CYTH domain-containing protein
MRKTMGKEIERRFLTKKEYTADYWDNQSKGTGQSIIQGYFTSTPCIRIRISKYLFPTVFQTEGRLTIKSKKTDATRFEFEYTIPVKDAEEMINLYCGKRIVNKIRHLICFEGKLWEVDEFRAPNCGLVIAEVELQSENELIKIPNWVDKEVTGIKTYSNHHIALANENGRTYI